MKEQINRLFRNFDVGAFLSVTLMLTGSVLVLISVVASLLCKAWAPMWLMVPAILSLATAAGMAL